MSDRPLPRPRFAAKPWGSELWFAHTEHYAGKILTIRRGTSLSLQYHEHKDETSYLLSGRIALSQGEDPECLRTRVVRPGETWHTPPGLVHTVEAIEDSQILEVSTPELEDVVRLKDRYGRAAQPPRPNPPEAKR